MGDFVDHAICTISDHIRVHDLPCCEFGENGSYVFKKKASDPAEKALIITSADIESAESEEALKKQVTDFFGEARTNGED